MEVRHFDTQALIIAPAIGRRSSIDRAPAGRTLATKAHFWL